MATPTPQKPSTGFFNEMTARVRLVISINNIEHAFRVKHVLKLLGPGFNNFGARTAASFVSRVLDRLADEQYLECLGGSPKSYKVI
jgi:hypothetical protein